jgi:hypothetical protein
VTGYLGLSYCDMCSHGMRQAVWAEGAARLCREHFEATTGSAPPAPPRLADLPSPPPAEPMPAWLRLGPGLRARPAGEHGVELQAVHNVILDGQPHAVSDGTWTLTAEQLAELVILASVHRDASAPNRTLARVWLQEFLHGKGSP